MRRQAIKQGWTPPPNDDGFWYREDHGPVHEADLKPFLEDDFQLANDAPKHKPQRFENEPTRQRVLVDGMDCLPGQLDLF